MRAYGNPSCLVWQWPRSTFVICPFIADENLGTNNNKHKTVKYYYYSAVKEVHQTQ